MSTAKKSTSRPANSKASIISKANGLFEPELRSIAFKYDARKRIIMGKKLVRWGKQLQASGKLLLSPVNGADVSQKINPLNEAKMMLDTALDSDLREVAAALNSNERRALMIKFQKWADQLARTIIELNQLEMAHDKTNPSLN